MAARAVITSDIFLLVGAAICLVVATVLAAIEEALRDISRTRASELAEQDRAGAKTLQKVVGDRARYINVLLFVRVATTVFSVVFVTLVCLRAFPTAQWAAVLLSGGIMLIIVYVVIGVAPLTLGQQHSETVALRGAKIARFLGAFLSPLSTLLILVGNALTPARAIAKDRSFPRPSCASWSTWHEPIT